MLLLLLHLVLRLMDNDRVRLLLKYVRRVGHYLLLLLLRDL